MSGPLASQENVAKFNAAGTALVNPVDGTAYNLVLEKTNFAAFPATGIAGIYYVDLSKNTLYRWNTSTLLYVRVGAVGLNIAAATILGSQSLANGGVLTVLDLGSLVVDTYGSAVDTLNNKINKPTGATHYTCNLRIPLPNDTTGTYRRIILQSEVVSTIFIDSQNEVRPPLASLNGVGQTIQISTPLISASSELSYRFAFYHDATTNLSSIAGSVEMKFYTL